MQNGNGAPFSTRQGYATELTLLAKADDGLNSINDRQRQTVVVNGFSIRYMYQNVANAPMYCNIAIVNPKNANSSVLSLDGFFRDYNQSRDVNFSDLLSALELHTLPINTDRYRVLAHKRHVIPAANLLATGENAGFAEKSIGASGPPNFVAGKMWVPLKRQIQFNDDLNDSCEHKCFYVVWFDLIGNNKTATSTGGLVSGQMHAVTYFNEVPPRQYKYNSFNYAPVVIKQTL